MSSFQPGSVDKTAYVDPTPLPDHVPKVAELGVTSAPLKSAAFFIGAYCKDYNGTFVVYVLRKTPQISYRGFYALQGREPKSRTLSKRGSACNAVCDRLVRLIRDRSVS